MRSDKMAILQAAGSGPPPICDVAKERAATSCENDLCTCCAGPGAEFYMYPEDDARGGGAADCAAFAHLFAKLFNY